MIWMEVIKLAFTNKYFEAFRSLGNQKEFVCKRILLWNTNPRSQYTIHHIRQCPSLQICTRVVYLLPSSVEQYNSLCVGVPKELHLCIALHSRTVLKKSPKCFLLNPHLKWYILHLQQSFNHTKVSSLQCTHISSLLLLFLRLQTRSFPKRAHLRFRKVSIFSKWEVLSNLLIDLKLFQYFWGGYSEKDICWHQFIFFHLLVAAVRKYRWQKSLAWRGSKKWRGLFFAPLRE